MCYSLCSLSLSVPSPNNVIMIVHCTLDTAPCLVGDIEVRHGNTHEDECSKW